MARIPKTTAKIRARTGTGTGDGLPLGFLNVVAQKVGPIKNELLGTVLLLSSGFGGLIGWVTYVFRDTVNPIAGICGLCFVFMITAITLCFYLYVSHLGYQSTRQEELRQDTRAMRQTVFSESLPQEAMD